MLTKKFVDAAGAHWVETVSDSIFENSRMGDDELWGTALVDGAPSKPGAVVENDQIRLTVLTYLLNTHSVVAAGSFCEVVSNSFV